MKLMILKMNEKTLKAFNIRVKIVRSKSNTALYVETQFPWKVFLFLLQVAQKNKKFFHEKNNPKMQLKFEYVC